MVSWSNENPGQKKPKQTNKEKKPTKGFRKWGSNSVYKLPFQTINHLKHIFHHQIIH